MSFNSYKEDEQLKENGKLKTLLRLLSYLLTYKKQIIAVDFDGTLCFSTWPDTGEPNQPLIDYLKIHKKAGDKLILWTCRSGVILEYYRHPGWQAADVHYGKDL